MTALERVRRGVELLERDTLTEGGISEYHAGIIDTVNDTLKIIDEEAKRGDCSCGETAWRGE